MAHTMRKTLLAGLCMALSLGAQPTMFPAVRGTREMVGAANNFEVEAGYRILMQGGNAVDAGVASVLAAAVTEQSRFGLGGEMPLLIKMAGDKPVVAISGVGVAPTKATPEFFKTRPQEAWEEPGHMPPIPAQGIRSAITPGVFDGLILALRNYGTMSFAQVATPAIEYAEGFPIGEEYASFLKLHQKVLELWPTSKAFFLPNGEPVKRGEMFRSGARGKTLKELASVETKSKGKREKKLVAVRDYFYKGPLADRMVAFSDQNGGLFTKADLANYHAEVDQPKTTTFRGYAVYKPGFWTQGPVMLEALNILEGYDLKAMGHNSPQYLHTVIEAVKLAFADRDAHYGDPKFSKIPEETLLSKEYAAERRKLIDPHQASMESRPGRIGQAPPLPTSAQYIPSNIQDTTSVDVVDKQGNVFSATPSGAWLPSVIAGDTGIPLSTRLQSFVVTPGHANELKPGKRPRVTLSPTIVLKDGKPFLAMSTPGGDNQDQAMLQVLLNIIEFGMTPQEAAEAPRFQTEHFYSSFANHEFVPGKLNVESRLDRAVVQQLTDWGHKVNVTGPWSNGSAPVVILLRDGVIHGAADPRRGRFIFGR